MIHRLLLLCCLSIKITNSAVPHRYSTQNYDAEDSPTATQYYIKRSSNNEAFQPKFARERSDDFGDVKYYMKREVGNDQFPATSHVTKLRQFYTKRSDVNANLDNQVCFSL